MCPAGQLDDGGGARPRTAPPAQRRVDPHALHLADLAWAAADLGLEQHGAVLDPGRRPGPAHQLAQPAPGRARRRRRPAARRRSPLGEHATQPAAARRPRRVAPGAPADPAQPAGGPSTAIRAARADVRGARPHRGSSRSQSGSTTPTSRRTRSNRRPSRRARSARRAPRPGPRARGPGSLRTSTATRAAPARRSPTPRRRLRQSPSPAASTRAATKTSATGVCGPGQGEHVVEVRRPQHAGGRRAQHGEEPKPGSGPRGAPTRQPSRTPRREGPQPGARRIAGRRVDRAGEQEPCPWSSLSVRREASCPPGLDALRPA
jgi:hypothetical protein